MHLLLLPLRLAAAVGNVASQPIDKRIPSTLALGIQTLQQAESLQPVGVDVTLDARHDAQLAQYLQGIQLQSRIRAHGRTASHMAGEHGELATAPQGPLAVQPIEQHQHHVLVALHTLEVQHRCGLFVATREDVVDHVDAIDLIETMLTLWAAQQQSKCLAG